MVDQAVLRAYWSHRQGLDGSLAGADSATVLERVGWARSEGIVDRGRLIGLWDFDPEAEEVVWSPITDLTAAQRKAKLAAVKRTTAYVRDDLGDKGGMSLDSPKSRQPRLAALREHSR